MNKLRKVTTKLLELKEGSTYEEIETRYRKASKRIALIIIILGIVGFIFYVTIGRFIGAFFDKYLEVTGVADPFSFQVAVTIVAVIAFGAIFIILGWLIMSLTFGVLEYFERRKNKKEGAGK